LKNGFVAGSVNMSLGTAGFQKKIKAYKGTVMQRHFIVDKVWG
jgi:hypothetical protein